MNKCVFKKMNIISSIKRLILLILILINVINSICNDDECINNDENSLIRQWIYENYEDPIIMSTPVNGELLDIKLPILDQVINYYIFFKVNDQLLVYIYYIIFIYIIYNKILQHCYTQNFNTYQCHKLVDEINLRFQVKYQIDFRLV